ncbi:PREDICTED: mesencephalic astrocyte-derived neurotrophic factor-like [Priapulus caudatus]|uniref:Mesencephalic astrocyte-derived neurotrophic factor homolog n=1 Tax=Priapulus caudatus TaxID=37621 RepID=A0ABM1EM06_PRICU|nr:PREDICTED: mesencephalic astrocyte-derived neurotrophic factor-like [Priapulus caudatus]
MNPSEWLLPTFIVIAVLALLSNEVAAKQHCEDTCEELRRKRHRFCYYIGGLKESATSRLGDISKPVSYHLPPEKICEKLSKQDGQICDLVYDKKIDFDTIDFKKTRVKELKRILSDWGEDCRGCVEKDEYINRVKELIPKHAPKSEL